MTHASQTYYLLEQKLLSMRNGTDGRVYTEEEFEDAEDQLLEQMGDLWWEMTAEECQAAEDRCLVRNKYIPHSSWYDFNKAT
jgi:hypothetical protein